MHSKPHHQYQELIRITQTEAGAAEVGAFIENFLQNPQFQRMQIFSNQAIRILDTSSMTYLHISDSNKELTGYSVDEIAAGGLLFTYRKTHLADIFRLAKATIKVKSILKKLSPAEKMMARFSFDARFTCKDGSIKKVLQNCHILQLSQSFEPLIILFSSTDITPYKTDQRMNYTLSLYEPAEGFKTLLKDSLSENDCPLSIRELEILNFAANGLSTKEIADRLILSSETIKTHRRNMLVKVNAKNSMDLFRMAIANNWI